MRSALTGSSSLARLIASGTEPENTTDRSAVVAADEVPVEEFRFGLAGNGGGGDSAILAGSG